MFHTRVILHSMAEVPAATRGICHLTDRTALSPPHAEALGFQSCFLSLQVQGMIRYSHPYARVWLCHLAPSWKGLEARQDHLGQSVLGLDTPCPSPGNPQGHQD